jgi:hypothetical protein
MPKNPGDSMPPHDQETDLQAGRRMMNIREILNNELAESDIRESRADMTWRELSLFALSFDAFEHWGSFEKCAEIAEQESPGTLTDLRTKLFMMQRFYRHSHFRGHRSYPNFVWIWSMPSGSGCEPANGTEGP